jgi:hypothetical protein
VTVVPDAAEQVGTFDGQARGHLDGMMVRMTCYAADYRGSLQPDSEIEGMVWLTHADRHRSSSRRTSAKTCSVDVHRPRHRAA